MKGLWYNRLEDKCQLGVRDEEILVELIAEWYVFH
jgi:hypothetical protein